MDQAANTKQEKINEMFTTLKEAENNNISIRKYETMLNKIGVHAEEVGEYSYFKELLLADIMSA